MRCSFCGRQGQKGSAPQGSKTSDGSHGIRHGGGAYFEMCVHRAPLRPRKANIGAFDKAGGLLKANPELAGKGCFWRP